jgi:transposase
MNNQDKSIGFDIGDKTTTACVIQEGQREQFKTFRSDVPSMQAFLEQHRQKSDTPIHLTFEVSGQAGYWYDHLTDRVDKQLAALTEYLDGYLAQQAGWKVLRSIPGVGPRTAEAVLAHTDDVKRFAGGKEYGAYFGLTPKLDESGESRRVGHISKQGPSVVRGLLVESAWRAIRSSRVLRKFYERVMAGQPARRNIAIVAVARKVAVIMRAMLLHGRLYDESLVGCGKA